jgi:hypothetical protein
MRKLLAPVIACVVAIAGAAAETDPLAAWAGTWRGRCEFVSPNQATSGVETSLTIAAAVGGAYA